MRFGNVNEGERVDPSIKARVLVALEHNIAAGTDEITTEEVYVVWFCYILGGWKAMLSTTVPNDKYYEVTYDKAKDQTYVDSYLKTVNTTYNSVDEIVSTEGRVV